MAQRQACRPSDSDPRGSRFARLRFFVRAVWNSLASRVFPLRGFLHGGTCIGLSSDETTTSCGGFFGRDDPVRISWRRSTR
jgi:hypothetical protein